MVKWAPATGIVLPRGGVQEWAAVLGFARLGHRILAPDRRHDQAGNK
jgi:hypothetical protein